MSTSCIERGICLTQDIQPLTFVTDAVIFDSRFHTLHTVELPGLASRTRISSDGRYAATTTFVHGDSYADAGFSTRTSIIAMKTGSVVLDLEKLEVTKDGESFHNVDFNFWGVTFVKNSHALLRNARHRRRDLPHRGQSRDQKGACAPFRCRMPVALSGRNTHRVQEAESRHDRHVGHLGARSRDPDGSSARRDPERR